MSVTPSPTSDPIQVNSPGFANQYRIETAPLDGGGFFATWETSDGSYLPGSFDRDVTSIWGRLFAEDGTALGSDFYVNTDRQYTQRMPSITKLSDGGFLVTFGSIADSLGNFPYEDIAARRFDAAGAPVGSEYLLQSATGEHSQNADVTTLNDGTVVLIWMQGPSYGPYTLYGKLLTSTGTPSGTAFAIGSGLDDYFVRDEQSPQVKALTGGGFVVTWMKDGTDGKDVYVRQYCATGTAVTGEILVNTTTADTQRLPDVIAMADGGYLVAWGSGGQEPSGYNVYAQRFDASGNPVGGEMRLNTNTASDEDHVALAALPDGGFVASWTRGWIGIDYYFDIVAQRFDADGNKVGDEFVVNTATGVACQLSYLSVLESGELLVAWKQDGDLYTRSFDVHTIGTSADETFTGTPGNDVIAGQGGNDSITGLAGLDTLSGGDGNDTVDGGPGEDSLSGDDGNDLIRGGTYADTISGGTGRDTVYGDDGRDVVDLGDGNDVFHDNSQTGWFGADSVDGGLGLDTINGGGGNDTLNGDNGEDSIDGGADNDLIRGGSYADRIDGGTGNDTVYGDDGRDVVDLGDGNDVFYDNAQTGWFGEDSVLGGTGLDTIFGMGGNDTLKGGDGEDHIEGGVGNDHIEGGDGDDYIEGGDGDDYIEDGSYFGYIEDGTYADTVFAGSGNDTVLALEGRDVIDLGSGNDEFYDVMQSGWFGADSVLGGDGNDLIRAGGGNDTLEGGIGLDNIDGGEGNDSLLGGSGEDTVIGGEGNDYIDGGTYADFLDGQEGNDTVIGGDGRDEAYLGTGNDLFIDNDQTGWFGADMIRGDLGIDTILAAGGNDTIYGGPGEDSIEGGEGDDWIDGESYADVINAGNGNDTVYGGDGRDTVDLGSGDDLFEDNSQWTWYGEDVVLGGYGNDTLNGRGGHDSLKGQWGDDVLSGGTRNDTLDGGIGNDTLTGGTGSDQFLFNTNFATGTDEITDWEDGLDRIAVQGPVEQAGVTLTANALGTLASWAGGSVQIMHDTPGVVTFDDFDFI
ncbi:calcium-binding protein [Cribrihabitans sp. XS_ASV171]